MVPFLRATFAALFSLTACLAFGQSQPVKVDVDFATFAYDEETSLLELYLAIGSSTLQYEVDSTGLVSELPINLALEHSTVTTLLEGEPDPIWVDSLVLQFSVTDSSLIAEGQHFLHRVMTLVAPGEYELSLTIPAEGEQREGQIINRDVLVPDYSDASGATISDIQLATSIKRAADHGDEFYKNGLSVRPNPHVLFGSNLQTLFYYFETYNTSSSVDTAYTAYTFISESTLPQPVGDLQARSTRQVRSPDAIVGSFEVGELPSGSYLLNIVLLDDNNRSFAEQSRKFFVYNPGVVAQRATAAADLAYETSLYASMSGDELDEQIEYALIIATDREEKALKNAKNEDGKRDVLLDFWSKRDPDPRTPINEVREEYFSRLQYARERYSNAHTDGWRTDRGRVYLKYGMPEHVNPHHYERDMAPYEIWEYDNIPGEGHAMFVFADVSGFSEFELIHSNVTGERQSLNWQQELRDQ